MGQAGTQLLWVNKAARTAGSPMQVIISGKGGLIVQGQKVQRSINYHKGQKGACA